MGATRPCKRHGPKRLIFAPNERVHTRLPADACQERHAPKTWAGHSKKEASQGLLQKPPSSFARTRTAPLRRAARLWDPRPLRQGLLAHQGCHSYIARGFQPPWHCKCHSINQSWCGTQAAKIRFQPRPSPRIRRRQRMSAST